MLGYIRKFLLDSFPSIIATIVGAYIVHHYVIPAAAPKVPASAVASEPAAVVPAAALSSDKASFEKAVAEKSAIEKAAEKASDKSPETSVEAKRRAKPRVANRGNALDTTGSLDSAPSDERRDANDLARAAIERLRNAPGQAKTVALAPAPTVHNADEPSRAVSPMLPLPPAVAVTKSPDVFNGGAEAALPLPALHSGDVRSTAASKLTPPADIPATSPIELHAEAQDAGRPSMAQDVMSAAKSVFHAVLPR